jgi:hypothetical protein
VVAVSELARNYTTLGAVIASLPLTTYLAFIWIYAEAERSRDEGAVPRAVEDIAGLSVEIVWLVLPSLAPFVILPWLLRKGWGFPLSLTLATLVMLAAYWGLLAGTKALGWRG